MSNALMYDLMLETAGILRSSDVRLRVDRDLEPGETIGFHGRRWLVTQVSPTKQGADVDRRAIAQELPQIPND
jgi:hypothetical protein